MHSRLIKIRNEAALLKALLYDVQRADSILGGELGKHRNAFKRQLRGRLLFFQDAIGDGRMRK